MYASTLVDLVTQSEQLLNNQSFPEKESLTAQFQLRVYVATNCNSCYQIVKNKTKKSVETPSALHAPN